VPAPFVQIEMLKFGSDSWKAPRLISISVDFTVSLWIAPQMPGGGAPRTRGAYSELKPNRVGFHSAIRRPGQLLPVQSGTLERRELLAGKVRVGAGMPLSFSLPSPSFGSSPSVVSARAV
jgi:hypothetical protein